MRIVIAGGHGRIALLLARRLRDRGHEPVGLIRNADHAADLAAAGAQPVVLDLESSGVDAVAAVLAGADAAVFAAGGGPDSGAARKLAVDRDGAVLLADAAVAAGVRRLLVVSSMGADDFGPAEGLDADVAAGLRDDPDGLDVFTVYQRAKGAADAAVRDRDLDWTIVRPGGLVDDAPTGSVTVAASTGRGTIPRSDVAEVIAVALDQGLAIRRQFEVVSGPEPIPVALQRL
ncbi:NAD(P)H-binding protein [Nakamurella deserti]|uniref:NAD(P)H-binding protein n=1 Tax=Nakamurella deserti TaxID=2164074 RepID=UPI000DBE517E|nr:NAD(P)H-binding protein [Nakamurella deserti]